MPRLPMKFRVGLWLAKLWRKIDVILGVAFLLFACLAIGLAATAGLHKLAGAAQSADQDARIAEVTAKLERMNQTMKQLELECKR